MTEATQRPWTCREALVEALVECAGKFRACLLRAGTAPEYADIAVAKYLALAKEAAP